MMIPCKQIKFLGFLLDKSTMSIALPLTKITDLRVLNMLQKTIVSTKALARLVGKLVATKPTVNIVPLHYRALQSLKIVATHQHQEMITLSPEATEDLKWWHTHLPAHCFSPVVRLETSIAVMSDASM